MYIRTFITDEGWQRECRRRLDEALEDTGNAKKALEAILANSALAKELPKRLYLKVIRKAL